MKSADDQADEVEFMRAVKALMDLYRDRDFECCESLSNGILWMMRRKRIEAAADPAGVVRDMEAPAQAAAAN